MKKKIIKKMKLMNSKWLIGAGVVLVVVICSVYYFSSHHNQTGEGAENTAPYIVPALTKPYTNSTYNFSLNIPSDFTVKESDMNGSHTIVFENAKSEGIQIVIAPYDQKGVKVLTRDMIQSAIPDMQITDDQVLEIGNSYKGLAFKSDNDAFDGDSREVWFIFKDNLYQISTYSRFDELLKRMFGTWQFK